MSSVLADRSSPEYKMLNVFGFDFRFGGGGRSAVLLLVFLGEGAVLKVLSNSGNAQRKQTPLKTKSKQKKYDKR